MLDMPVPAMPDMMPGAAADIAPCTLLAPLQAELDVVYPLVEAEASGSTDNAALAARSRQEHAQVCPRLTCPCHVSWLARFTVA